MLTSHVLHEAHFVGCKAHHFGNGKTGYQEFFGQCIGETYMSYAGHEDWDSGRKGNEKKIIQSFAPEVLRDMDGTGNLDGMAWHGIDG